MEGRGMGAWEQLDLSDLVASDKELSRWAWLRKRMKNTDDYVSIRHGFSHVGYSHVRHAGPAIALMAELSGVDQEEFHLQSLKVVNKQTGVAIKYASRDLVCICCEKDDAKIDVRKKEDRSAHRSA